MRNMLPSVLHFPQLYLSQSDRAIINFGCPINKLTKTLTAWNVIKGLWIGSGTQIYGIFILLTQIFVVSNIWITNSVLCFHCNFIWSKWAIRWKCWGTLLRSFTSCYPFWKGNFIAKGIVVMGEWGLIN